MPHHRHCAHKPLSHHHTPPCETVLPIRPPLSPAGYTCTTAAASPCPLGTYNEAKGTACKPCSAGYACPSQTMDREVACPPGTYANAGDGVCTSCSPGVAAPWAGSAWTEGVQRQSLKGNRVSPVC